MSLFPSSPIGLRSSKQKKSWSNLGPQASATSYLAAVSEADARARSQQIYIPSPTSTPALSLSSSLTGNTEDSVLAEEDEEDSYSNSLIRPSQPPNSETVYTTAHTEFGHCNNQSYRYTSRFNPSLKHEASHAEAQPPYYILLTTYVSYLFLIVLGHLRDFVGKRVYPKSYQHLVAHKGYAPLNSDFDSFYVRRLKLRIDDCFSQPVTGVAGRTITILDRDTNDFNRTQFLTGQNTRTLNISSYNYLGFAQAKGGVADAVDESLKRYGISSCGSRLEGGTSDLHVQAESLVAKFVGMEDALISSMGFATNSTIIPALVNRGCLVISDELNHASIRTGVRFSGATVRMFKHNNMSSLESLLRECISQGQTKTHRPWKKILLIVEGLYSMEGTILNLPAILELKKKYKFFLFVDEAHSIGAMGPKGRGVCDFYGVDPRKVDILMGTFTKSFGAAGGYIAGNKTIIDRLRLRGHSGPYAEAMTPPVLIQLVAAMASIMGVSPAPNPPARSALTLSPNHSTSTIKVNEVVEQHPGPAPHNSIPSWMTLTQALRDGSEGSNRLRRLAFNSRYLANGLKRLGFLTVSDPCSPIVPVLIFNPGKLAMFHRMMLEYATPIVVVVVAYPATPLISSRVRFCVSAAHTKDDIDTVLAACDYIGDILDLKHGPVKKWPLEKIQAEAVELASEEI